MTLAAASVESSVNLEPPQIAPADAAPETFSDGVFAAFRAHFGREPTPGNEHDAACLMQLDIFEQVHGRLPDTRSRADLAALQQIELSTLPDDVGTSAELLSRRAAEHPFLNAVEAQMRTMAQVDCPLTHRFTPGLYIRELLHPKGVLTATKIHRTEFPFVISQGSAMISTGDGEWTRVQAPHTGITKPGTRRLIFALEDMVITTFHPTEKTDLDEIEADLIFPHTVEPALPGAVQVPELQGALE
jgi:hypothetical protein